MEASDSKAAQWRLLVDCSDRPGLVHQITGVLFRANCNVLMNHEYADAEAGRFFMRTEFVGGANAGAMEKELKGLLPIDARIRLTQPGPRRLAVLVSKEHHCVADILIRCAFGELDATVAGVISNHRDLEPLVAKFDVPFHYCTHEGVLREEHERRLQKLIEAMKADYVVLAKYMRILGKEFVSHYPHRMINIHHSFLPAFVGARPYQQAFERGVKVIGATAHFVTEQLDEGPIIVQQVIPVDHSHSPQELSRAGRDVEQMALARSLRLVLEDRVFLNGNRTVIFD